MEIRALTLSQSCLAENVESRCDTHGNYSRRVLFIRGCRAVPLKEDMASGVRGALH